MSFVSDAIEMAITRLTKQLLEHDAHNATSLVCAQGEFYRVEIRLGNPPEKPGCSKVEFSVS